MKSTEIRRISKDLADEIQKISIKNEIKFTEASKEIAKFIKNSKSRKIIREIQF